MGALLEGKMWPPKQALVPPFMAVKTIKMPFLSRFAPSVGTALADSFLIDLRLHHGYALRV